MITKINKCRLCNSSKLKSIIHTEERLNAILLQAQIYSKQSLYLASVNTLKSGLETDPYHWEFHEALIDIFKSSIDFQHAEFANEASYSIEMGQLLLLQNKPTDALEQFQKVEVNDEDQFIRMMLIGRSFLESGRYDLSINQFQKLLR